MESKDPLILTFRVAELGEWRPSVLLPVIEPEFGAHLEVTAESLYVWVALWSRLHNLERVLTCRGIFSNKLHSNSGGGLYSVGYPHYALSGCRRDQGTYRKSFIC
jgi:hypothetical protein